MERYLYSALNPIQNLSKDLQKTVLRLESVITTEYVYTKIIALVSGFPHDRGQFGCDGCVISFITCHSELSSGI